jgi:ribose/xylose/arabinose/galactoside ABC-type transport system permease subunit
VHRGLGIVIGAEPMVHGIDPWLASRLLVHTCGVLGALNGVITTLIASPSFLVTLASALLFRGAALALGAQMPAIGSDP